jgi:protein involved in polysaccharide export with SLBB domain
MIATLKRQEVDGRLVVRIGDDIGKWENTPDDIEVREGDVLIVPKRPTFVLVSGQVYNRTAISWVPGKNAGWYLRSAGGPTENANRKAIFIIRANGLVVGQGGTWSSDVLRVKLQPGDAVVVPEKIATTNSAWRGLMGAAQLMSAFALTASFVAGL